jgi:integrase
VGTVAGIDRRHLEGYRRWLAARPGYRISRLTPARLAHRLGTLRMFFVWIGQWDWPQARPGCRSSPVTCPARTIRCRRLSMTRPPLPRAAQAAPRVLVRVAVEVLLRTGLRVGEFTGLRADAVLLIGAVHWLHVPVGKLREDRYLPLHPHLASLIDEYRTAHVAADHRLLLPRGNGRPLDRHTLTRLINKAGAAAGLPHPPSCAVRAGIEL